MERLQVILINKIGPTAQMITSNLTKLPNVSIMHKHSVQEALSTITLMDKVDLIICQTLLINEDQLAILNKTCIEKSSVFLGLGKAADIKNSFTINDASDWVSIIKESVQLLSKGDDDNEEFLGFELNFFKLFKQAPCDIYICVKKAKQYDQFIKRIHKDDIVDEEALERYAELNVKSLHIRCLDSDVFLSSVTSLLEESLKGDGPGSSEEVMKVSVNFTSDLVKKMGLKKVAPALVSNVVKNLGEKLNKVDKQGARSLSELLSNKDERYFNQVFLTGMIGGNILSEIGWGTAEHKDKVTQAAFFCDIYLNFPAWSTIKDNDDFAKFDLTEDQKYNILNHAKLAYDDIQNFSALLPDVDKMILHHHGNLSGKGLSLDFPDSLSKLSLVFNLAYNFAVEILKASSLNDNVDYSKILEELENNFKDHRNLEKTLTALNSSFVKKLQAV